MNQLKKDLDFDSIAVEQLYYALYKFRDAVITVIRSVSKPHWMFALDSIVRHAVHVGIMILSPEFIPEFAVDLGDGDDDEVDELSNSGVSTVNSAKIKHHTVKDSYNNKILLEQVKVLKNENFKLINELLESHKSLQSFLKANDGGIDVLKGLIQQLSNFTRNFERTISLGYFSDDQNRKSSLSTETASPSPDENEKLLSNVNSKKINIPLFKNPQLKSPLRQCHDMKLMEWLSKNGFDEEAKIAVGIADFTYEDLIYVSDKDDIRRIGLRYV